MPDAPDLMTQRALSRLGQVLRGKWKLDKLLGVGGMASVYAATHRNGKRGAVKMLHVELAYHEDARNRFLREGYVANKVDHPGAVSVLDDDVTDEGAPFLVMELLEGASVDDLCQARPTRRLEIGEVVAVVDHLLDVLAAAHEKGIVHRDLKPENVFVTRRGELKVLDFGIARLREIAGPASATKTGSMMGTPSFMPPEQALGNWDQVDLRSDLWAVGATAFLILTGRHVHVADTVNKVLLLAMSKPAPPIRSVSTDVPPAIAAIIDRSLAFEQAHRWQDARSMRQALQLAAKPTLGSWALPVPGAPPSSSFVGPAPVPPASASSSGPFPSRSPSGTELSQPVALASSQPAGPPAATFSGTAVPAAGAPRRRGLTIAILVAALGIGGAAAVAIWWSGKSAPPPGAASQEPSAAAPTAPAGSAALPAVEPSGAPAESAAAAASAGPSAEPSAEPSAAPSVEAAAATTPRPQGTWKRPPSKPTSKPTPNTPTDRDHGF